MKVSSSLSVTSRKNGSLVQSEYCESMPLWTLCKVDSRTEGVVVQQNFIIRLVIELLLRTLPGIALCATHTSPNHDLGAQDMCRRKKNTNDSSINACCQFVTVKEVRRQYSIQFS